MQPSVCRATTLRRTLLSTTVAVLCVGFGNVSAAPFYKLESAVTLKTAAPNWDYVALDQKRGRLFIGRRGDGLAVFDIKANKLLQTIDDSAEANATIMVDTLDRGYSVNEDGTSTVFELSSLKTLDRLKLGDAADSGTFEPVTGQLVITMSDEQSILFVDAKTGKPTGKLKLEAKKFDGLAADGKGNVFIAERDRNAVAKIDAKTRTLAAEWKTDGCEEPTGLAFDAGNQRVFVGCRGKAPVLAVIDAASGRVVATPEIGRGNDGVIYDAQTKRVYTANGVDGNLVIYDQTDANSYKLVEATTTRPYARTFAIDRDSRKLYLVTAEGTVDPSKKVNKGPAPFYPNTYHADTFAVLTYSNQ